MIGGFVALAIVVLGYAAMTVDFKSNSANADDSAYCDSTVHACEAEMTYTDSSDADSKAKSTADQPKAASKPSTAKSAPSQTTSPQKGSLKGVALDEEEEEDCRFNIAEGAVSYVSEDCIISGDVLIAETEAEVRECARIGRENQWRTRCAYHDNNQLSGHTVLMLDDGYAYAAWGASVHSPGADPEKTILAMKENMGLTGCGNKTVMPDGSHLKGCAWKVYAIGYPDKSDVK